MTASGAGCVLDPGRRERRGLAWIVGGFAFCPCHLAVTLSAASVVLTGTALGTLVTGHPYLAGTVATAAWGAATWRGLRHLRQARDDRRESSRSSLYRKEPS